MPKRADDGAEETPRVAGWKRPEARYQGGQRVYGCAICRDQGRVSLPRHQPDETDEQLLAPSVPRYSYLCPSCRHAEQAYQHGEQRLPRQAWWRLLRWRDLQLARMQADQDAEREVRRVTLLETARGTGGTADGHGGSAAVGLAEMLGGVSR